MTKLGYAILFSAALMVGPLATASAQDDGSSQDVPGRYVVTETDSGAVLTDTAYGRTWILVKRGDGHVWRRVFLETQGDVPEGLARRPPKLKN